MIGIKTNLYTTFCLDLVDAHTARVYFVTLVAANGAANTLNYVTVTLCFASLEILCINLVAIQGCTIQWLPCSLLLAFSKDRFAIRPNAPMSAGFDITILSAKYNAREHLQCALPFYISSMCVL